MEFTFVSPKPVEKNGNGKSDRENLASIASTDNVKVDSGNLIPVPTALKEIREWFNIPEPTQQRNDPCSDKGVILAAVGSILQMVRTEKAEKVKFADSKK